MTCTPICATVNFRSFKTSSVCSFRSWISSSDEYHADMRFITTATVHDCEMDPEEFFKYDYTQPMSYYVPDLPEGVDALDEAADFIAQIPDSNTTYEPTTSDPPNLPGDADAPGDPNESIVQIADSNTINNRVQSAPAQVPPEVYIIPPSPTLGAQEETGDNEADQEESLSLTGPTVLDISKRAAEYSLTRILGAQEECLRGEPGEASTWRCLLKIQEEILRTAIKDCTDDKNEKHHKRLDIALRLGSTGLREHTSKECRSAKKQGSPSKAPPKTGTPENGTSHDGSPEQGPSEQNPSTPSKKQQKKRKKKQKK